MQVLIVTVVVLACCVYSSWTLMPTALRRPLAGVLMRNRWLARWAPVQRAAQPASAGCGCDGCDKAAATTAQSVTRPGVAGIRIVARQRR